MIFFPVYVINCMNGCIYDSINVFPKYVLSPGHSGDDLALWLIQNYNVHYCTFLKMIFPGTNHVTDYIYGS